MSIHTVTLTDDEMAYASAVALYRITHKQGKTVAELEPLTVVDTDQVGAELAVAKALNIFPNLNEPERPLIGHQHTKIGVTYSTGVLPMYPAIPNCDVWVVVTGKCPAFFIQGYVQSVNLKDGQIYQSRLLQFGDGAWYPEIP